MAGRQAQNGHNQMYGYGLGQDLTEENFRHAGNNNDSTKNSQNMYEASFNSD